MKIEEKRLAGERYTEQKWKGTEREGAGGGHDQKTLYTCMKMLDRSLTFLLHMINAC